MTVANLRTSSRWSETVTGPSTFTKENGGASSSTTSDARPSRTSDFPLPVSAPVLNTMSSPSRVNQIGATWGEPSEATQATLPVRVPWRRKSRTCSSRRLAMTPSLAHSATQQFAPISPGTPWRSCGGAAGKAARRTGADQGDRRGQDEHRGERTGTLGDRTTDLWRDHLHDAECEGGGAEGRTVGVDRGVVHHVGDDQGRHAGEHEADTERCDRHPGLSPGEDQQPAQGEGRECRREREATAHSTGEPTEGEPADDRGQADE